MRFGLGKKQPGWGVPEGQRDGAEPPSPYPSDYFTRPEELAAGGQDDPNPYLQFDAYATPSRPKAGPAPPRSEAGGTVLPAAATQDAPPAPPQWGEPPIDRGPATHPPTTLPPPPGAPVAPGPRGSTRMRWVGGGIAAAIVLVGGAALVRAVVSQNDPPPPPISAPVSDLQPTWSAPLDGALYWDVDGFGRHDSPAVVTRDVLIIRVGDQAYDEVATGLVGLAAADGTSSWTFDLPDARCAETSIEVGGLEAVACAGEGRVLALGAADGTVLMEATLDWNPQRVASGADGVMVIGATDPDDGATPIAWVSLDGTIAWESDLAEDPAFLNTLYPNSDGELEPWAFNVAEAPSGVMFSHDGVAYRANSGGLSESFTCFQIWVGTDGYACSEGVLGPTAMLTWDGQEQWRIAEGLAGYSLGWQTPTTLAEPRYSSATQEILAIDPETGELGVSVVDVSDGGYATLRGTSAVPLLEYGEELLRLSPETGEVVWRAPIDEYPLGDPIVAGDRVLVPGPDDGADTVAFVVNADDGEAIAEVDWTLTMCTPIGERQLLCLDYRDVSVIDLP